MLVERLFEPLLCAHTLGNLVESHVLLPQLKIRLLIEDFELDLYRLSLDVVVANNRRHRLSIAVAPGETYGGAAAHRHIGTSVEKILVEGRKNR